MRTDALQADALAIESTRRTIGDRRRRDLELSPSEAP